MNAHKGSLCFFLAVVLLVPPGTTGLAAPEPVPSKERRSPSTFSVLEESGGKEVDEEKLEKVQGEGFIGALTNSVAFATVGAATEIGSYVFDKALVRQEVPDIHKVGHQARKGAIRGGINGAILGACGWGPV